MTNPVYIGQIVHRDKIYEGDHPPIIGLEQWHQVQELITKNRQGHRLRQSTPSDSLLSGLVFDEKGNRLIASHSQKHSKRYRYYLTEQLQIGTRKVAPTGIRIPASELENIINDQLINYLGDTNGLLNTIHAKASALEEIKQRAQALISNLQSNSSERYHCIRDLVKKLTVYPKSIELEINLSPLYLDPLQHTITVQISAQIERCGFSTKLLIEGKIPNQKPDSRLIESIAKAYDWLNQLTTGQVKSIGELATKEGATNTIITSTIYRAFLAPDIVRSILKGTHPHSLTSSFLKTQMVLPIDWDDQRALFGINKG